MFAPFLQSLARHYCLDFISDIESGVLNFKQVSKQSDERKDQGVMVGSLVCSYEGKRIVLHAISGISKEVVLGSALKNTSAHTSELPVISAHKDTSVPAPASYTKNGILHIIVPAIASEPDVALALTKNDERIHELTSIINTLKKQNKDCTKEKNERTTLCDESLRKVFSLYTFTRFDQTQITLDQIISLNGGKLPPTGTGDCCAPKLLSYAFKNGYEIISMDEVYFGKDTQNKTNGVSYTPCDERCCFILPHILGLEILYRDSQIIVVNKQSGLLSVPGRGEDKKDSVEYRVRRLFGGCIEQPAVHRLDMETSGILVLAFTKEAHKNLNKQFEEGRVQKKYTALLDGLLENAKGELAPKNGETSGLIKLKFRLDVENRPHQIYDEVYGKEGITEWKKEGTKLYVNPLTGEKKRLTRVTFIPHTGRTHQLRLASASLKGLGLPITGDTLYGNYTEGERLMLHACEITFEHPVTKERMHFMVPPPF